MIGSRQKIPLGNRQRLDQLLVERAGCVVIQNIPFKPHFHPAMGSETGEHHICGALVNRGVLGHGVLFAAQQLRFQGGICGFFAKPDAQYSVIKLNTG